MARAAAALVARRRRGDPGDAGPRRTAAIASAIAALEAGEVVGIFPEGGVGARGRGCTAQRGWRSRRGRRSCRCGCSARARRSGAGRRVPALAALIGEPIAGRAPDADGRARARAHGPPPGGRRGARHLRRGGPRRSPARARGRHSRQMPGRRFGADVDEPPERPADPAVRKANLRRIFPLFRAYRPQLAVVFALIIFSAALGVIPAFLLEASSTRRSPRTTCGLLTALVAGMIADPDRHRRDRRLPDAALEPGRPGGHARPAHVGLPAPAAAVARVLHAHPHGRRAEPDRQRHRRHRHRRHLDRDVGALERDDRDRDGRRDGAARLAPRRVRPDPAAPVRLADEARRRPAQEGDRRAAGVARRRLVDRAGVALGLGDPARQDDGPLRRPRRALLRRVAPPRRPRGAKPDDRPLDDGRDPDDVRGDAGARLLVRRLVAVARATRDRDRHARRLHDAPDAAVLPDRQPARRPARGAELAGAVRPHLRVPRPADRHRRGHADARASARRRRLRPRLLPLRRRRLDAEGRLVHRAGRHEDGARRRDRLGQDDVRLSRRAALRRDRGHRLDRRHRRARADVRVARRRRRRRLAGDVPLPLDRAREPPLREARRDATRRSRRRRGRRRSTS